MHFRYFLKNSLAEPNRLKAQRGQALVEYALLLFVVVAISVGLMNQFSKPFQKYVTEFFGTYVACLLESGELPNNGGQNAVAACARPQFDTSGSVSSGSNGAGGSGGSGSKSGGSGGDGQGSNGSNSTRGNAGNSRGKGKSAGSGDGANGPGANGLSRASANRRGRPRSTQAGEFNDSSGDGSGSLSAAARANKKKAAASAGIGAITKANGRNSSYSMDGRYFSRGPEGQKSLEEKLSPKTVGAISRDPLKAKIAAVANNRKPAKVVDDEAGVDFSMSTILRWAFILGLILALVVIIGGQALQISKSWEK